jgi:hypothetical protein
MDEARLAEIEHVMLEINGLGLNDAMELIAEVRRLKKAVNQAYNDGESSGLADIEGILLDPEHPGDDAKTLAEIKEFLGWEGDTLHGPRLLAFIDLARGVKD